MMGIGIALIVIVIAVGVYLAIRATSGQSRGSAGPPLQASTMPKESALDLLDARYAKGEIEREDYLNRRQDLLGRP